MNRGGAGPARGSRWFGTLLAVAAGLAGGAPASASDPEPAPEAAEEGAPADDPEARERRWSILPLPTLGSSPETGFYGGAVALVTARPWDSARQSSLEVEGTLTAERQRVLTTDLRLFTPGDRVLVQVDLAAMRFPEDWWGVGPDTPASAREGYDADRLELALEPLVRPAASFFVGPSVQVQRMGRVRPAPGGLLASGSVPGASGGTSSGAGLAAVWEGRAVPVTPAAGEAYGALRTLGFGRATGSDFAFSRTELDLRAYLGLGPGLFALQGFAQLHGGRPPFRMLGLLGGDSLQRGFYQGRYRDRQLLAGQAEVRMPVWWRLGLVAFGSLGAVSPSLSGFRGAPLRGSGGGGLRIRVDDDEGTSLRMDLAVAQGSLAFYVSFGEAF